MENALQVLAYIGDRYGNGPNNSNLMSTGEFFLWMLFVGIPAFWLGKYIMDGWIGNRRR